MGGGEKRGWEGVEEEGGEREREGYLDGDSCEILVVAL